MTAFVNDRDVLLEAAPVRNLNPTLGKALFLVADAYSFHVDTAGAATPAGITLRASLLGIPGAVTWEVAEGAELAGTTANLRTLAYEDLLVSSVAITARITYDGETYEATQTISKVRDGADGDSPPGADGTSTGTAYLFQWSLAAPEHPTGAAAFSWLSGAVTGYGGADAWSVVAPANPGTPLVRLWVASKGVVASAGVTISSVTFGSGATVRAYSQNGANGEQGPEGIKAAIARAFQWGLTAPTAIGSAVWTWAAGTYNTPPSVGWSAAAPAPPGQGYSLFEASVHLLETAGAATSAINWGTAAVTPVGYLGTNGSTTYTWIKYASSATGAGISDSPTGMSYIGFAYNKSTAVESTDPADYTWSLIKGADGVGVKGDSGADGQTTYTWIKYSDVDDGTGLYDTPTPATLYIGIAVNRTSASESTTKTDYVWSKFRGDQGVPGANGTTTYTWIKYASSAAGAGLSDDPSGKAYIGFAYNKSTAVESTDPADYTWSLIKGADGVGVKGDPGADGQTTYTWIKYSDVDDGTGLYDTPTPATLYIGIAVNRTAASESTAKTDYVWSKFRGDQGVPGSPGTPGAPGAPGSAGASARIAYTLIDGASLNTTPANSLVAGDALPATGTWGETRTWVYQPPQPMASQAVFVSDGLYYPVLNQTVWNVPYLANLKVGNLSAISANLGSITAGSIHGASVHGGDISSWGWPAGGSGLRGFYIGPEGFIAGNYNDGVWVQITASGTFSMPGLSMSGGAATFTGAVSGATVTGGLIQTAASGKRLVLNASGLNNLELYDDGGAGLESLLSIGIGALTYAPVLRVGSLSAGNNSAGIVAYGRSRAIYAQSIDGIAIETSSTNSHALSAASQNFHGVHSTSLNSIAIYAFTPSGPAAIKGEVSSGYTQAAVYGRAFDNSGATGVYGESQGGTGVEGYCGDGTGVAGGGGGWAFYATSGGYGPFTGSHDGLVALDADFEEGDILVDGGVYARHDVSNTISINLLSSAPLQKTVIGVFVKFMPVDVMNMPAALRNLTLDEIATLASQYKRAIMNALGEGQINVCGENGDIAAGDYITTSSMPGKGMRQTDDVLRNCTVAKSREAIVFSSPSEVRTAACTYHCG